MSPSEIAFLAFGLVLGAAIGAALVQASGLHLAPRREVRLTITPNAIPARRAHTLAVPYDTPHPGIIPGSPEAGVFATAGATRRDAWHVPGLAEPGGGHVIRTHVQSVPVALSATAVAVPVAMAASGSGGGWPVTAAGGPPAMLARSRLEAPVRDDPFATPVSRRPAVSEGRPTATEESFP